MHYIRYCWDDLRNSLSRTDLDNRPVNIHRRCISPKGLYSYRIVTQIDPIDFLFYTALIYEIGNELECYRVPADQNIVHSSRFNPSDDGRMYDLDYGYSSFLQTCRQLVQDRSCNYVVVTDIADFFPRIYFHRIESALDLATRQNDKKRAIEKMIKGWHDLVSYGIPVGSAASRIIAEATISDIDQYLISEDTKYCRYSDDFRIFCESEIQAYSKLETLAWILYENHGLFLQPGKTKIMTKDSFIRDYLQAHYTTELASLRERFDEIADGLELGDPYEDLDYDMLDEESQEAVDALNLHGLLEDQLGQEVIDVGMFKFLLRRLGQLNQSSGVDVIINDINKCYHLIPSIVRYLRTLYGHGDNNIDEYSNRLFQEVMDSEVCQVAFNRSWILSLSAENIANAPLQTLMRLIRTCNDDSVRRKIVLSLGRAQHLSWFRTRKNSAMAFEPWTRRAYLAASSCLAPAEIRVWQDSVRNRLDELEKSIVAWVRSNPF